MLIASALLAQNASDKTSESDFIRGAFADGLGKIKLGELAAGKASDAAVKAFGERMVDDHNRSNRELDELMVNESITRDASSTLSAKDRALYDLLNGMSGTQFDQTYIREMVRDYRKEVKEYQKEADAGRSSRIKDFASNALPVVKEHLKLAEDAASHLGVTELGSLRDRSLFIRNEAFAQ
jgi:putative membrane protein